MHDALMNDTLMSAEMTLKNVKDVSKPWKNVVYLLHLQMSYHE